MYQVFRTGVRQALGKLSSLGLVEVKVGGWRYHQPIIEAFQRKNTARAGGIMQEHTGHSLEDYG